MTPIQNTGVTSFLQDEDRNVLESHSIENFNWNSEILVKSKQNLKIFKNCHFHGSTIFKNMKFNGQIVFIKCEFSGEGADTVLFEENVIIGIKGKLIIREDTEFNIPVKFIKNSITELRASGIHKRHLNIVSSVGQVDLGGINGHSLFYLNIYLHNNENITQLKLSNILLKNKLLVVGKPPKQVFINDGQFNEISFVETKDFQNLKIQGDSKNRNSLKIDRLSLNDITLSGVVYVADVFIKNLQIKNFRVSSGDFTLYHTIVSEEFNAKESNLSGCKIKYLNLSGSKLILDRCFLNDCVMDNIVWPNSKEIISLENIVPNDSSVHLLKTDVYRQLKRVSTANSNEIDALLFRKLELNSYWMRVKNDKSLDKWNKFLIRVDKNVSDFGQSYTRPLLWLVCIHLILCSIIWTREYFYYDLRIDNQAKAMEMGLSQFLKFILPTFEAPEYWTGTSVSISVAMRLINGFLIFHFIRAIRKYSKV